MFMAHIAFSMQLLVLLLAVALLVWSLRTTNGSGVRIAKVVSSIVILITIFNFACTTYYAIYYWQQGYYKSPMANVENTSQQGSSENMQGSGMSHIGGRMHHMQGGKMHMEEDDAKQGDETDKQEEGMHKEGEDMHKQDGEKNNQKK